MKPIRWTGKGGDTRWSNAANWNGGVPGTGVNVLFEGIGSFALDLTGVQPQLGSMTVLGERLSLADSRIDLESTLSVRGVMTDLVLGHGGSLALTDDALLFATNVVQVGNVQNGTLTAGTLSVGAYSGGDSDGLTVIDGMMSLSGPEAGWSSTNGGGQFITQIGGAGGTGISVTGGASREVTSQSVTGDMFIGDNYGDGSVVVSGPGSTLSAGSVQLGAFGSGMLLLGDQASASLAYLDVGTLNSGVVSVSGDATLTASGGINLGSEQPPVAATLSVTNHGSVYAGSTGLELQQGTLVMDPTATLFGAIGSLGGRFDAVANADGSGGTVRLGQPVTLGDDFGDQQLGGVSAFASAPGVTLLLGGQVTSAFSSAVMAVTAGHLALTDAANSIAQIDLAGGRLTIGATGADGGGTLSFLSPYTQKSGTALLEVSANAHLTNKLAGLGNGSRIDLQGFAFDAGVTATLSAGTLTLDDGSSTTTLVLLGTYTAGEFAFMHDAGGGTVIGLHKG